MPRARVPRPGSGSAATRLFGIDAEEVELRCRVFGKGGGETTVYASDKSGNVIWSANVRVGNLLGEGRPRDPNVRRPAREVDP